MEHFPRSCRDDPAKLRQVYLRLALAYHPDKILGRTANSSEQDERVVQAATHKFQAIQAAYEALSGSSKSDSRPGPKVRSAFCAACELGDLREVVKLLRLRPDVNKVDDNGVTPLMFSARGGSVEVCKLLLDARGLLDVQNPLGWTALTWASLNGHIDVAKFLLERGARSSDNDLIVLAFTGNCATFEVLLNNFGGCDRVLAVRDKKHKGLLHFSLTGLAYLRRTAVEHFRCVELIIEAKCDPALEDHQAARFRSANGDNDCQGEDFATPCCTSFQESRGVPVLFHFVHSMAADWAVLDLDSSRIHHYAIRLLCSLKSDPLLCGPDGRNAVEVAKDEGMHKTQDVLLHWESIPTPEDLCVAHAFRPSNPKTHIDDASMNSNDQWCFDGLLICLKDVFKRRLN